MSFRKAIGHELLAVFKKYFSAQISQEYADKCAAVLFDEENAPTPKVAKSPQGLRQEREGRGGFAKRKKEKSLSELAAGPSEKNRIRSNSPRADYQLLSDSVANYLSKAPGKCGKLSDIQGAMEGEPSQAQVRNALHILIERKLVAQHGEKRGAYYQFIG